MSRRVDEQLRLRVEYLVTENRILRSQIDGRLRLTDEQRITLATIGKKLGKAVLEQIASIVTPGREQAISEWLGRLGLRLKKSRSSPASRTGPM